jgi:hypothetical protein
MAAKIKSIPPAASMPKNLCIDKPIRRASKGSRLPSQVFDECGFCSAIVKSLEVKCGRNRSGENVFSHSYSQIYLFLGLI